MGIQNALMRITAPKHPASTVMTGNFTQLTIDLVQLALPEGADAEVRGRIRRIGPALALFVIGAGLGAYGISQFGFWCMALPAAVVGVLAVATRS